MIFISLNYINYIRRILNDCDKVNAFINDPSKAILKSLYL